MLTQISIASPEHAARIAQIHMAAFGSNAMLLAQFPTEKVRKDLERSIEMKARADIEDPKTTVIIALTAGEEDTKSSTSEQSSENASSGTIIGFAKWAHPIEIGSDYEEPAWIWPEGTAHDVLSAWSRAEEEAQKAVIGSEPRYSEYTSLCIRLPVHELILTVSVHRAYIHCYRPLLREARRRQADGRVGN
jgi:hypothetical protein